MLKALRTCLFRLKYLKNECECIFLTFPVSAGRLQLFASQWRKVYFLWQLESLGEVEVHSDDTILQSPLSAAAYIQQQTTSAKQSWTKVDMLILFNVILFCMNFISEVGGDFVHVTRLYIYYLCSMLPWWYSHFIIAGYYNQAKNHKF